MLARDDFLQLGGQRAAAGGGFVAVYDAGEGVHALPVHHHVQLHHIGFEVSGGFVIHAAVATGDALDAVVKVNEDFVERQCALEHHAGGVEGLGVFEQAALITDEVHHVADVFVGANDEVSNDGFLNPVNDRGIGHVRGVVDFHLGAVGEHYLVNHAGVSRDDVHVELAPQTFLDDFQMQQAKKTATKSEAKRYRAFGLVNKRGVIELQLGETPLEAFEINGVDGVNATKHHRLHFFKAGQNGRGIGGIGDGVAHFHITRAADVGGEIPRLTRAEAVACVGLGVEAADLFYLDGFLRMMHAHPDSGPQFPIENPHVNDDAFVRIVN